MGVYVFAGFNDLSSFFGGYNLNPWVFFGDRQRPSLVTHLRLWCSLPRYVTVFGCEGAPIRVRLTFGGLAGSRGLVRWALGTTLLANEDVRKLTPEVIHVKG